MESPEDQKKISEPLETSGLGPTPLSAEQEDLCRRLDDLHTRNNLVGSRPSDMFRGAMFAASSESRRANPDWAAQAAHSLRDILYPFYSNKVKQKPKAKKKQAFQEAGGVRAEAEIQSITTVYYQITDVAHHANPGISEEDFFNLVADFENAARRILSRPLDIHKEIDDLLAAGAPGTDKQKQ